MGKYSWDSARAETVTQYFLETEFIRLVINKSLLLFSCWETSEVPSLEPSQVAVPTSPLSRPGPARGQMCSVPCTEAVLCHVALWCTGGDSQSHPSPSRSHLHSTSFVPFLLCPRQRPTAGHLTEPCPYSWLWAHFLCVLAESLDLAVLSWVCSMCPFVPLSFSPGFLHLGLSPAKLAFSSVLALCPPILPVGCVSSDLSLFDSGGCGQIFLSQLPSERCPRWHSQVPGRWARDEGEGMEGKDEKGKR